VDDAKLTEFEFLENIRRKFSLRMTGDDCAVLPKNTEEDMLVTADMLIEDIDFRFDWAKPEFIGHKALAVSLSDIAAMGGTPEWALLSIGIPEHLWGTKTIDNFYKGWHKLAKKFKVELVGGDISRAQDKLVIDSVVGGSVPKGKAILRSTARPEDLLFVTGLLGGGAGGLKLFESGVRPGLETNILQDHLMLKHLQPWPQVHAAKQLQEQGIATAAIDLSDGLSSDLHHVCKASSAGARIYAEKVPIDPNLRGVTRRVAERLDMALNGGDDFELLFTCDKKYFSDAKNAGFFHIGEITANEGNIELIVDGEARVLSPKGYRHF
jgi:thiamine-monophosphate kinase